MDYITVGGIAVGLAMDAFAVAMMNGAVTKNIKLPHALKIAFCFGFFQFIMPIIGWGIGKAGAGFINQIDHWIAFILLSYIGGKMLYDAKHSSNHANCRCHKPINLKTLILLSVATSIDALATGIILPSAIGASTAFLMLYAAVIIGAITFLISFLGVYIGKKFGTILSSKAELLGGILLIAIGMKILIEALFF